MSRPQVRTWADGFGLWHARVQVPEGSSVSGDYDKLRRAALRAIRRELTDRDECGPGYRLAVKVVEHDARSIEFRELEATK